MTLNRSEILEKYEKELSDGFVMNSIFKKVENTDVVLVGCKVGENEGFIPEIGLKETRAGVFEILCPHKKGTTCLIKETDCTQKFEVKSLEASTFNLR